MQETDHYHSNEGYHHQYFTMCMHYTKKDYLSAKYVSTERSLTNILQSHSSKTVSFFKENLSQSLKIEKLIEV